MNTRIALLLLVLLPTFPACTTAAPCPSSSSDAGPAPDADAPKPIDAFVACDTFDDLVARNAERWACGSTLPECPWPRLLDVRCEAAAVLETLAVVRTVSTCGEVLAIVDGTACTMR